MAEERQLDHIGAAIEATRVERGLTRDEVRRAAEISLTYLGKIERGERVPQPAKLAAIATAMGVPPSELIQRAQTAKLAESVIGERSLFGGTAAAMAVGGLLGGVPLALLAAGGKTLASLAADVLSDRTAQSHATLLGEVTDRLSDLNKDQLATLLVILEESQDDPKNNRQEVR